MDAVVEPSGMSLWRVTGMTVLNNQLPLLSRKNLMGHPLLNFIKGMVGIILFALHNSQATPNIKEIHLPLRSCRNTQIALSCLSVAVATSWMMAQARGEGMSHLSL